MESAHRQEAGGRMLARGVLIACGAVAAAVAVYILFGALDRSRSWMGTAGAPGPWNILLVSLDTTRPDRLEACEGTPVLTPALNRVRGGGCLFTEMITPAPITLPAHASLFTACNPYRHGVRENTEHALPEGTRTLAAAFREAGYLTAAFLASFMMDSRFGLDQGFDLYEDRLWGPEPGLGPYAVEIPGAIVAGRAARWIGDYATRRRGGGAQQPFFLFVHFFDAHAPYRPPPPFDEAYPSRPYEGELAYQDQCLGSILDALELHGEADRTLVWVISDHGESLGEHGELSHSIFVYDCTVRIVSILRPPPEDGHYRSGPPRKRITTQTGLISVAPTLLDLTGLDPGFLDGEGVSLLPLLKGKSVAAQPLYCETLSPLISYHWSALYAVRTSEWKYIRAPTPELYNLKSDPREAWNQADLRRDEVHELDAALEEFLARTNDSEPGALRTPTPEERERLRSLGYLSAQATPGSAQEDLPDPKEMIYTFRTRYLRTKDLVFLGRYEEAAEAAREALRHDPLNNALYSSLGTALRGLGRPHEAGRAYCQALRIQPQSPRVWLGWGRALLRAGEPDSAVWAHERSIALLPRSPDSWIGLGDARWVQGRPREAAAAYDSALARGGDPAHLHGLLARLYRDELEQVTEAQRHLAVYARLRKMSLADAARDLPRAR
jgi:arylsulfatase A-like enzyme/Tfp pilus assembly protein PilF